MSNTSYRLRNLGIRPAKRLGQNFLVAQNIVKKFIAAAELSTEDTVVEVGAGTGTITIELAKLAKKVIAVEKDKDLIPILQDITKTCLNVEIIEGDILRYKIPDTRYTLVGNIPYYLTAPLIRKSLETESPPTVMVLMVQKEVAQRICAKPPDMSILAVSVQVYAKPEIIAYVSRSAFWPQPKVDSAILRVSGIKYRVLSISERKKFFGIVRAGFSSPRKQLLNNLSKKLTIGKTEAEKWLRSCGIAPERRAETLSVEEWLKLASIPK